MGSHEEVRPTKRMYEYANLHGYRPSHTMKQLTTIYTDGYADYTKFRPATLPSFQAYAEAHGYEVVVYDPDPGLPVPGWGKLPALLSALEHCRAALWCDADLRIRSGAPDVLDALAGTEMQAMVCDTRHDPPVTICFWLTTRAAVPFLEAVWAQRDACRTHPNGETYAVHQVLRANPRWLSRTHRLDATWMTEANEGRYLVHADYNRGSMEQRIEALTCL